MRRKLVAGITIFLSMILLVGCLRSTPMPDLSGVDYLDAKNVITAMNAIPVVTYEENEQVEKNIVIRTEPSVNARIRKNDRVTIVVSNGGTKVQIPSFADVDYEDAKAVLTSMGLIPVIQREYHDTVAKDMVIGTDPLATTKVDKGEKITLHVSDGPSKVSAKSSYIRWYQVGSEEDYWEFTDPYINIPGNILIIHCEVEFGVAMEWELGPGNYCYVIANASLDDDFDKAIPLKVACDGESFDLRETQRVYIEVPLDSLGEERPTSLYLRLPAKVNGRHKDIKIEFTINW